MDALAVNDHDHDNVNLEVDVGSDLWTRLQTFNISVRSLRGIGRAPMSITSVTNITDATPDPRGPSPGR